MMFVKTILKSSKIHGIGLFAGESIPKGTVLWKFVPCFDLKWTKEELSKLPEQAREYLEMYTYLSKKSGLYIFCVDNGKHFNHTHSPNTSNLYEDGEEEVITRALRDIRRGEELTCDYREFERKQDPV